MKKLLLLLMLWGISIYAPAETWIPYGPQGMVAENIVFGVDLQGHVAICTDGGMYLVDGSGSNWNLYTQGLPVIDAAYYDGSDILTVLGAGSYSDGIYLFDPLTGLFGIKAFCVNPAFIFVDEINHQYYVGYEYGMKTSADGDNWVDIPYFSGMKISVIASYGQHFVVGARDGEGYHLAYSASYGSIWTLFPVSVGITQMEFSSAGILWGIIPGTDLDAGLYSSDDYGLDWTNELYATYLGDVGLDVMNHVFIGFETTAGLCQGVHLYDPVSHTLVPCNDGLTCLCVNRIVRNPYLSSVKIFVCTNDGVFMLDTQTVGLATAEPGRVKVYPNPASGSCFLDVPEGFPAGLARILVTAADGRTCGEFMVNVAVPAPTIRLTFDLPAGAYLVRLTGRPGIAPARVVLL